MRGRFVRHRSLYLFSPTLRRRISLTITLALVLTTALFALPVPPASAHGSLDQFLTGDPACNVDNFPGFKNANQTLRQEFVPSRTSLQSVDLCLDLNNGGATFALNIYQGNANANRPTYLHQQVVTTAQSGIGFVHVDLSALATTPGQKYVLEIPTSQQSLKWRADCTGNPCDPSFPDKYPAGTTNFTKGLGNMGANADFGFRTYSPLLDLTGAISSVPRVVCNTKSFPVSATVTNGGNVASGTFHVGVYASSDATITAANTVIGGASVTNLAGGASAAVAGLTGAFPASWPEGRAYVGMIVDDTAVVAESNETNNASAAGTAVFCGAAGMTLSLAADKTQLAAGSYDFPLNSFSPESIGFAATGTESTPLKGFPLKGFQLKGFPLKGFPLKGFPLKGFFGDASENALRNIKLSDVPIVGGWEAVLAGTIYENTPTQTLTLWQVLSLEPAPDVPVANVDFEHSPLRDITLGAVATAQIPLTGLANPGPGGTAWCTFFAVQGYDCGTYGIDASMSLVDVILHGVDADIPWSLLPFRDMALADSPLLHVRLSEFEIRQTPARTWLLTDLTTPSLFVDPSCAACVTLGDAEEQNKIVGGDTGPTFGDLVANLVDRDATLGDTTLGDYLMGALGDRDTWPVSALPLGRAPLFPLSTSGENVVNTLTLTSNGVAPVVDPQISVVPPPGFLLVPGTSQVANPAGGTFVPIGEPSMNGGRLTWSPTQIVPPGTSLALRYTLRPGLDLGIAGSTISAHAVDEFGNVDTTPANNQAAVRVVDTETLSGQANDDPLTGPVLALHAKRLGHVSSATDVDYYRIPVPAGAGCALNATGSAQPGCRVTVSLTLFGSDTPAADLDMALYGPETDETTQGAPLKGFPLKGFALDDPGSVVAGTETSTAEALQDSPVAAPLKDFPLKGFSATRGSSDETVEATTAGGETGYLTLKVWGYNGSTSPHSYVLSTVVTPPTPLPACTPRTYSGGTAGSAPALPSSFKTLLLVNQQRLGAMYGDVSSLMSHLQSFAARPDVDGVVYPIESDADVASAYTAWDANPCSVPAANALANETAQLVASVRASNPGLQYVVIAGNDEAIPSLRVADSTLIANEREYTGALLAAQNNTAITSAAATGHYLSDDVYATDEPFTVDGRLVYVPEWAVGRLVETPADIEGLLSAYELSGGLADAPVSSQTALVTGYDFASDAATETASALAVSRGSANVATLICETWTRQNLIDGLFGPAASGSCAQPNPAPSAPPDVAAINGHADNYRFLAANENFANTESDLFRTADVTSNVLPAGRIIFSVGCHFGMNLPDGTVGSPTADQLERLNDWAQAFSKKQALLVANSSFGYGDTATVAFSERLMQLFAEGLDGTQPAGDAFVAAKQSYFLNHMGMYAAYDEKALQEAILYGLPMFGIAPTSATAASAAFVAMPDAGTPLATDPVTGMLVRPFDSGALTFDETAVLGQGSYYALDGNTLAQNARPIVPQGGFDVTNTDTANPDHRAVGLFVTGYQTSGVAEFDPVFAGTEYDAARPEQQRNGAFPTAPGAITSLGDTDNLVLWPARFMATSQPNAATVKGDLLLRNRVTGKVYYSTVEGDAPRILRVTSQYADATHLFLTVRTNGGDNAVKRVGVLIDGVFVDLQRTGTGSDFWTGTAEVPSDVDLRDVLVQAVSDAGVGYWANKGDAITPIPASGGTGGLQIHTTGTQGAGQWFLGDVTATVTGPAGVPLEISVDGGAFEAYTGAETLSGTGQHLIQARGYDSTGAGMFLSASKTVLIDADAPTVNIVTPSATTYEVGSAVNAAYTCADVGSGIALCTGTVANGAAIDTSTIGTKSFTVSATDLAGQGSGDVTVNYTVVDTGNPTASITSPTATTYEFGSAVAASYTCADSGSGIASCVGTVPNGSNINTTTLGPNSFVVTATDDAGNVAQSTVNYTVADTVDPTVTITTPVDGASYVLNSTVNASYSCADSGSGIASCVGTVANGSPIDTSTSGTKTFTVTATDNAGRVKVASVSYDVVAYRFEGWFSPISNPPEINTSQAGNSNPFKWRLFDPNGNEVTSTSVYNGLRDPALPSGVSQPSNPYWIKLNDCNVPASTTGNPVRAQSQPAFRYDTGNHQFVFTAQSSKSMLGCWKFVLVLPDRSTRYAIVNFVT